MKTVGNIGAGNVRARHGFRPVKIDATRLRIQRNRLWGGHHVQGFHGFVGVQPAAEPGRAAFAVVRRHPVSHVVGVLGVAVVKHGIVCPQIAGRHVGKAAGRFNGVVLVQQRVRGCVGERTGRQRSKPFFSVGLITHVQAETHECNC